MSSNRGRMSSWLGFLTLSMAGILSRLPQLNYNQHPFSQCDENIYLSESSRMVTENTIIFNEFRGGGVNFFPTVLSLILGLDLDPASLQWFGRVLLSVVIGGLAPGLAFLLAKRLTRNLLISWFVGLSTLCSSLLLINSVYWYPDSYIASFALLAVLLTAKILDDGSARPKKLIILGIACGLGLSVKVTFVLVIVVILYLVWNMDRDRFFFPLEKSNLLKLALPAAGTWLFVNWPALATPLDFIRNNGGNVLVYQGETRTLEGLLFYGLAAGPMALGVLQSLILLAGTSFVIKSRSRIGLAAAVSLLAGVTVFGLQSQWLHRNMATFLVFGIVLLALGMHQISLRLGDSRPIVKYALASCAAIWIAATALSFVSSAQERFFEASMAKSLHSKATDFVLRENPATVLPSEPGCQRSVYDQAIASGWKPGLGEGVLNVNFSNASRLSFVSDPLIRLIPEQSLELVTVDLYRPESNTSWVDKVFGGPIQMGPLLAEFTDGFFKYQIYRTGP